MILSRRLGFAVVLIPQGGTTEITAACQKVLRPGEILAARHLPAASMAGHLQGLRVISVHRNPWARIYSAWQSHRHEAGMFAECGTSTDELARRTLPSEFESFVRETFLSSCWLGQHSSHGFWPYYCHAPGSVELVTDPWPYEDLAARWAAFSMAQSFPPLGAQAGATHGDYRNAYSPRLRDDIGAWAAWEIERFDYDFARGESCRTV